MEVSFDPVLVAPFSRQLAERASALLEQPGFLSEVELEDLVRRIAATPDLWRPLVVIDRERRRYELLYDDDRVDIWVLSWMQGQRTGFHDHDRSRVGLVCAEGVLDEGSLAIEGAPETRREVEHGRKELKDTTIRVDSGGVTRSYG